VWGEHTDVQAAPISQADTSPQAKQDGVQSIPFAELKPETQAKIQWVVSRPSIYRRLPLQQNTTDADMHLFLVRYPEVVVNIWELMNVTKVSLRRTGQYSFHASDGAGTVSDVQLVYGTPTVHIFYTTTQYTGPLMSRPITAKCVLLLKSKYEQDRSGETIVTNQLDVFVRIDNRGVNLVAKALQPLVGRAADFNFRESVKFLSRVSRTAEENSDGVQRLATRLKACDVTVRERFSQLSELVADRADARMIAEKSRLHRAVQRPRPTLSVGQVPIKPVAASKNLPASNDLPASTGLELRR
jgi:hypothetical protein